MNSEVMRNGYSEAERRTTLNMENMGCVPQCGNNPAPIMSLGSLSRSARIFCRSNP